MTSDQRLVSERFPRSSQYHPDWVLAKGEGERSRVDAFPYFGTDDGRYLGYVRLVGRRHGQARLADHIVSLPAQYTRNPLLRSEKS